MVYSLVIPKMIVCCLPAFNIVASFVISQYLEPFSCLSSSQIAGGLRKLTQQKQRETEESHFCIFFLWQHNKNDQSS